MSEIAASTGPRLYVGTYRKYNEGSIFGKWLDLDDFEDYEAFVTACKELHKDEADPEFMIQDYEGFPEEFYNESGLPTEETFDFLKSLADELDETEAEAFADFCDNLGKTNISTDALDQFREAYQGEFSEKEFAEHIAEECGYYDIMEKAGINARYFDEEAFAADLFRGGDYYRTKNGYVFRNE
jgi:antirestriction protein